MTNTRPAASLAEFGQFVDTHQVEILGYLRRLTGDATTADDLFQETFLRAFGAFSRLSAQSNHRAWLYRIATNQFLNHRRRRRRSVEDRLVADPPSRDA